MPIVPSNPDQTGRAIREAAGGLIEALHAIWMKPDFRPESGLIPGSVRTETVPEARVLPTTRRPVRGTAGVEVRVTTGGWSWGTPTLHSVVFSPLRAAEKWPADTKGGDVDPLERQLHHAFVHLRSLCVPIADFAVRLFETRAFKHHEPEEVRALVEQGGAEGFEEFLMHFFPLVEDALADAGFSWEDRAAFTGWDEAAANLTTAVEELATREFHEYDALAFLNGPLVDSTEPVILGEIPGTSTPISLRFADDLDLRRAYQEGFSPYGDALPASIRNANTVVSFVVRVPVAARVVDYLNVYPWAAHWMARILDVLRIAQPHEVGIGGLRVSARSRYAPRIRRWHSWELEPDTAPHHGRRTIFLPPEEVISEDEVGMVRALLTAVLPGFERKGLDVALSRFRDSYERYEAGNPQRLLDVAIAFEALLLNDGGNKELSYRLSLRGARWLDQSLEDRRNTFYTLQRLYEMRSKIAHGLTVDGLKQKEIARLEYVMKRAPELLRRTLQHVFEGRGPTATTDEDLREWWLTIELS